MDVLFSNCEADNLALGSVVADGGEGFLADKVLVPVKTSGQTDFIGIRVAQITHVVEARLARKRPRHDLKFCDLTTAELRGKLAQLLFLLGCLVLRIVNFKAQLFAREARAVDENIDAVNAVGEDLEEFLSIHRCFDQRVHHFQRFRSLHGVHFPLLCDILPVNVPFALVRLEPDEHIRAEQRRDPVALLFHAHDDDVVDDLGVIVQHRGIALAAEREIADGLREELL